MATLRSPFTRRQENYYLAKGMRKVYLRKVNPLLKYQPGYTPNPTDLMILQHAIAGFPGTPYSPWWTARINNNGIYGWLLVAIRRSKQHG